MNQLHINFSSAERVCDLLQEAARFLNNYSGRIGSTHHLPDTGALLVTGDLHDNQTNLTKIIHLANLSNHKNHLVLQELIHTGSETSTIDVSYRMLVRVASLVCEYPNQVHPILANHELSQATGRAIAKGGGELVQKFIAGVSHVFGKHTDNVLETLRAFILSMPLAVQSKSGLMCLHSLPNELTMEDFDPDILKRKLKPIDLQGNGGSAYMIVWGRQYSQEQVNTLAHYWGVKLFCLGHAWVPSGIDMSMPNVLVINSDHENGVALPLQLNSIQNAGRTMQNAIKLDTVILDDCDPIYD